jgi:uncharacterized protein (DUF433 family)
VDLPRDIEIRPDVMMGKPCSKGTRIPVYLILEKLGAEETYEQILASYSSAHPPGWYLLCATASGKFAPVVLI